MGHKHVFTKQEHPLVLGCLVDLVARGGYSSGGGVTLFLISPFLSSVDGAKRSVDFTPRRS